RKHRLTFRFALFTLCASSFFIRIPHAIAQEEFKPDQSKIPVKPPANAKVLLGESTDHEFLSMSGDKPNWPFEKGAITSSPADGCNQYHVVSKWHFRDADIHVEFKVSPKNQGNSGV
ncbi:MAG: hypothetical protein ACK5TC_00095, partial [bacterium]